MFFLNCETTSCSLKIREKTTALDIKNADKSLSAFLLF